MANKTKAQHIAELRAKIQSNSEAAYEELADSLLELATVTTAVLHVYADGTSGLDTNDGLSAAEPKKTLQAVGDMVPGLVGHNICINLKGEFDDSLYFHRAVGDAGAVILIDGGDETTVVADDAGSPWAADISTTSSIGLTTAGWTIDEFMGYWIEVLTGDAAGQTRQIFSNTASTLVPVRNFTPAPGAGAEFRVVRPTTTINGFFELGFIGGRMDVFKFQRLFFGASSNLRAWTSLQAVTRPIQMSHVVNVSTAYSCFYGNGIYSHYNIHNPTTFVLQTAGPTYCGCSFIGASTNGFALECSGFTFLSAFVSHKLGITCGQRLAIDYGCRITNAVLGGMLGSTTQYQPNIDHSSANFRKSLIGGGIGVGLLLIDSVIRIKAGDFSDCSTHGIEARNSRIQFEGVATGTGNTGAGVYAHSGSVVHIKNGSPPTLTGSVGDFSSDGTTEGTTWANLDAGNPYADAYEMTMAKEI